MHEPNESSATPSPDHEAAASAPAVPESPEAPMAPVAPVAPEAPLAAEAAPADGTNPEPAPEPAADIAAETAAEVALAAEPDAVDPPDAAAAPATTARPELSGADCARLLAEQFPALFGPGVVKPVKLRIQADIQQRAPGVFTKKAMSLFLHRHTTGSAYLRAMLAAETRFDLDGQPAGEIAPEHKEAARVEVERRRAIVDAKKEAGRQAARAAREAARPPRPPQAAPGAPGAPEGTGDARPPRPPRPPRPDGAEGPRGPGRPDRFQRPPRGDMPNRGPRPDSGNRPPRPDGPNRPQRPEGAARPPQGPRPDRPDRPPRPMRDDRGPRPDAPPREPMTPEQATEAEARRQRAMLLRSFEQSPLSKANFGALKGLSEAALDALLTQARQERERR